ncbi:MAG: fumarate reductase/succinate dehydrogenase flavoprotein domain protein [Microbacteriaceae bacterium]|jgi:tricarballylate dehydrogenase|nr:fumarate reductase/succinate dehydrogenase flavoprotein domain protein [Microbacteriaceae bacterium]
MAEVQHADVVIVGGGSAAHESAVAAKYYGADKVILLEKAPESQSGGNARFSGTGFRWAFDLDDLREITDTSVEDFANVVVKPYSAELFKADLNRVSQGRMDPEIVDVLVDDSNMAIKWAKEMGIEWVLQPGFEKNGKRYLTSAGVEIHPRNLGDGMTNGLSQLKQWDTIAERLGVEKRYDSKVIGFIGDELGIEGVRVNGPDGEYEIRAGAVIVAAGGFQANPEMRAKYLGPNADLMKVRGSRHNTGEVLKMLLALGVMPSGHWQTGHATPIDGTAPIVESGDDVNRYIYPWGVSLDVNGKRFFDEGEAESAYTYAKTGWAVQRQLMSRAFWFGDSRTWEQSPTFPLWHRPDTAIWADSLEELAQIVGLDPKAVRATIDEFNAAIDTSIPFNRDERDGRHTVGLTPDKSNWAQAIEKGPFYVIPVTGGLTFTFGGVTINRDSQVIAVGGKPIPGLFASGDILGIFFHNYPAMTGQTRNLVFGRRAGQNAAALVAKAMA